MQSELKPCPACGSGAKYENHKTLKRNVKVVCSNKSCEASPKMSYFSTKERAKEIWNKQAEEGARK